MTIKLNGFKPKMTGIVISRKVRKCNVFHSIRVEGVESSEAFAANPPRIDTISDVHYGCDTNKVFTCLKEAGYKSKLIEHFADCEQKGQLYKHPDL
jgi:hypothetical protein